MRQPYSVVLFAEKVEKFMMGSFPRQLHKRNFKAVQRLQNKIRSLQKLKEKIPEEELLQQLYVSRDISCPIIVNLSDEEIQGEEEKEKEYPVSVIIDTTPQKPQEKISFQNRKRKSFCMVTPQHQKRRLGSAYDDFCKAAEEQGLSTVQLAGE